MQLLDLDPLQRGVARWNGKAWVFGETALHACRLEPRKIVSDHWEALSLDPMNPVRGRTRHRADVAVAGLRAMNLPSDTPLTALVPGHWDLEALKVFLGAARECGLRVRWLFPRAVVMAGALGPELETVRIWEWSWNRLQEVRLRFADGFWTRTAVNALADGGVFAFFRRDAHRVRDLVLSRLRVDPLYSGETEQALFDGWWQWLHGAPEWVYTTADGDRIRLDDPPALLAGVRAAWTGSVAVEEAPDLWLPAPLRRLLGWSAAGSLPETPSLEVADHEDGAARWRETLPEPLQIDNKPTPPVTHVVVNGIARPWRGPGRPGDTVTLPDGVRGLAVHVTEDRVAEDDGPA